jgi:hypothetical protein
MLALKAAPSCVSGQTPVKPGQSDITGMPGGGASTTSNGISSGKSGIVFLDGVVGGASASANSSSRGEAEVDAAAAAAEAAGVGPAIMILDEIDSGIGSRLGAPIGVMLRRMAGLPAPPPSGRDAVGAASTGNGDNNSNNNGSSNGSGMPSSQIICVTHLAQVACHAEQHIRVHKQHNNNSTGAGGGPGRVTTRFQHLESDEDRIQEVAAMMGMGVEVAANVLASARVHGSGSGGASADGDSSSNSSNPYLP